MADDSRSELEGSGGSHSMDAREVGHPAQCWELPLHSNNIFFICETKELEVLGKILPLACLAGLDAEWRPLGSRYAGASEGGGKANSRTQPRVSILQIACGFRHSEVDLVKGNILQGLSREVVVTSCVSGLALEAVFVLDLLALPCDALFPPMKFLLRNPAILKLGFGLAEDMRNLSSTFIHENHLECFEMVHPHIDVGRMFHSVRFSEMLNESLNRGKKFNAGLSAIAKRTLGLPLDKREQCSDWERRPLTPSQLTYAACDAYCLFPIFHRLYAEAEMMLSFELERKWKENAFIGLAQILSVYFVHKDEKQSNETIMMLPPSSKFLKFPEKMSGFIYHRSVDSEKLFKSFLSYFKSIDHFQQPTVQHRVNVGDRTINLNVADSKETNMESNHLRYGEKELPDRRVVSDYLDGIDSVRDKEWTHTIRLHGSTIDLKEKSSKKKEKGKAEHRRAKGFGEKDADLKKSARNEKKKTDQSINAVVIEANFNSFDEIPPWDTSVGGDGIPKFLCDVMVEGLARHLRCVGIDAITPCSKKNTVRDLLDMIEKEGRILLTRDSKLLASKIIPSSYAFKVTNTNKQKQLEEVVQAFKIHITEDMLMSRCVKCNGQILPHPLTVEEASKICSITSQPLPLCVQKNVQVFWKCLACNHVYWEGTQFDRAVKQFSTLCKNMPNVSIFSTQGKCDPQSEYQSQIQNVPETSNDSNHSDKFTPLDQWKIPRIKKILEQGDFDPKPQQSWVCDCNKRKKGEIQEDLTSNQD